MFNKSYVSKAMTNLYKKRLITLRDGNLSYKPKNKNYFYISAGSVKKDYLNEDQIIMVEFDDKKKLTYNKNFLYQPSRELFMHSFLHVNEKYINKDIFVVHAHPKNIISFMGFEKNRELNEIKTFFPEINVGDIGKNVPYHDAGSINLATNCYDNLVNNEIVGLERHGTLSIGTDVDRIIENIETLEYYVECYLKSLF